MVKDLCRQSKGDGHSDWPEELFRLFTDLLDAELSEDVARDLVERLRSDPRAEGLTDPMMLKARAAGIIEERRSRGRPDPRSRPAAAAWRRWWARPAWARRRPSPSWPPTSG